MKTAEVSTTKNDSGNSSEAPAWLAGFFLLGVLLSMLGSLVISWRYHIDVEPHTIGLHFLAMSGGFAFASWLVPLVFGKLTLRAVSVIASALAFISLTTLATLAPPSPAIWRIVALAVTGMAAGALTVSLLRANVPPWGSLPASTANRAGAFLVSGGLLATIVGGLTYFENSIHIQAVLLAAVPGIYILRLLSIRSPRTLCPAFPQDQIRDALKDLRSIAGLLFGLLIFFQFACEWAIVGWLPLFLIHTLGINPVTAIWGLALYFLALMAGRFVAQLLLPVVSHKKMLLLSVAAAMLGYLLLSLTRSIILALTASLIIGLSHAAVFPLIAERLDNRFSYHPGLYTRTLSFVIAGAMATPWLLAYVAESLGMRSVVLIPAMLSIAVFILSVLIMLESRLMGRKQTDSHEGLLVADN